MQNQKSSRRVPSQAKRHDFFRRLGAMAALIFGMVPLSACELIIPSEIPNISGAIEPGTFPQSGTIGISRSGVSLYVVLPDHDRVARLDAVNGETLSMADVPGHPHRLTVLNDGRIAVSARDAGTVTFLSEDLSSIPSAVSVGSGPYGLVERQTSPGDLYVAVSGDGEIVEVSAETSSVVSRTKTDGTHPRGLASLADGRLVVGHFLDSSLATFTPNSNESMNSVSLSLVNNPYYSANQVESLTIESNGIDILVPHQECNNDPEQFQEPDGFTGQAVVPYYSTGPKAAPAVLPAITRVDINTGEHLDPGPGDFSDDTIVSGVRNPNIDVGLGEFAINSPVAVASADGGRVRAVVSRGTGRLEVTDSVHESVQSVDVGIGASGIVLSPDGIFAYVWNEHSGELTKASVRNHVAPPIQRVDETASDTRLREANLRTNVYASIGGGVSRDVRKGREIFFGTSTNVTQNESISCASCHADGIADGTTWQFAVGPRQTPPLWGKLSETFPLHWDNAFADMSDLNENTIKGRMGGLGLDAEQTTQLELFIDTIPVPAAPSNLDLEGIERGRAVFHSTATRCTQCHYGPQLTDGEEHNVGTRFDGEKDSAFSTPPLHGLAHTAPYMHHGHTKSLKELVVDYVATDKMGIGSHLSEAELNDLAIYLESL